MGSHFGAGDSFCGYYRGRDVVISAQFNESTVWEASTVQHIDIYLPYDIDNCPEPSFQENQMLFTLYRWRLFLEPWEIRLT